MAESYQAAQPAPVYDGSGVTVGIISDSFDAATTFDRNGLRDDAASDIAAGLLPDDIEILVDHPNGTDEGRAMAQIVHTIAPGASIAFETGAGGQAVFAQHILDLAAAGAKIIVDDIGYPNELDYQNGIVAQAINQVVAEGVTYFSAAGNNGHAGYEGAFSAGGHFRYAGIRYTAQRFSADSDPLTDTLLPISGQAGQAATIQLEWSQPAASTGLGGGASGDLDLLLTDAQGHIVDQTEAVHDNVGKDPVEVLNIRLPDTGTYYLRVGLRDGTEAPAELRLVAISDGHPLTIGAVSSAISDSTLIGHKGAEGDIPVGAVHLVTSSADDSVQWLPEPFSSSGTDRRLYDDAGAPLTSASVAGVDIAGIDGVPTSFFASGGRVDAENNPLFFGTSAAAPQVAAIAALLLEADPSLTPAAIRQALENTATRVGDVSDAQTETGQVANLVQADAALKAVSRVQAFADRDAVDDGSALLDRDDASDRAASELSILGAVLQQEPFSIASANLEASVGSLDQSLMPAPSIGYVRPDRQCSISYFQTDATVSMM